MRSARFRSTGEILINASRSIRPLLIALSLALLSGPIGQGKWLKLGPFPEAAGRRRRAVRWDRGASA